MSEYLDARVRRLGFMSYGEYLQSPLWKVFRDKVRASACYACGNRDVSLQVHHITYTHLGNEHLDDVVTLCDHCHKGVHGITKNDVPLAIAHEIYRAPKLQHKNTASAKRQQWVSWFKLRNTSKHQTLEELRAFLVAEGLSTGTQATQKAKNMRLVRMEDGKEWWHLRRYISMMQQAKKRAKCFIKNSY